MEPHIWIISLLTRVLLMTGSSGLECYLGLGTSTDFYRKVPVYCDEEMPFPVCVKIHAKDFGDQIKRECQYLDEQAHKTVQIAEDLRGLDLNMDPTCHELEENGRTVEKCHCTRSFCNGAASVGEILIIQLFMSTLLLVFVFQAP